MNRILQLTLICSLLFLSRAAIDLNQWEFFTDNTAHLSFNSYRMAKQAANQYQQGGWLVSYLNPATKQWNPSGPVARKFKVGPGPEEFYHKDVDFFQYRAINPSGSYTPWVIYGTYVRPQDHAATMDNHIWFIAADAGLSSPVRRFNRNTKVVTNYAIEAKKIAVDPSNNLPWVIKANGDIFKLNGASWIQVTGKAKEIAFGSNNRPYIVSQDPTPEGFAIKRWNPASGGSWETIPGIGGVSLAIDPESTIQQLYVVTNDNKVYRQKGFLSAHCPMCRENCPECVDYEGFCAPNNNECISCSPGSVAVLSPLRCEACPPGCQECSSPTTCTDCKPNHYLSSDGTTCGGPCVNQAPNIHYYPVDGSCRSTCEVPIVNPNLTYQNCDPCPENCLSCSTTTFCLQCSPTHYLSSIGTCLVSCDPPLVGSAEAGNLYCKGPCSNDASNPYYYSSDSTCRSTCAVPTCLL